MSIFDQINDELDMEFFLSRESIAYKSVRGRSGLQLNVRECPNPDCRDRRYRVYLNAESGQGNCFVCNETFSKVKFIKHYIEGSWKDTARYGEEVLREQGWRPKRKIEMAVETGDVVIPLSEEIAPQTGNIPYLEQRGIDVETARYFHLRVSEFGLYRFRDTDDKWKTQDWSDRLIIPVYDLDGTLKTFQGRYIGSGETDQKYLFPKGLPGTGRYLLNGHNFALTEEAVLGEGFFDVAATKLAFEADPALHDILPLGSFGKHLSYGDPAGDDQLGRFIQLRKRGLKKVTIMWDGEEKALIAALDAGKMLTRIGLVARIALLPYEKDPNEVAPEVVREAYYKAQTWTPMIDAKMRLKNPYRRLKNKSLDS